jgi:hypothetical protein
VRKEPGDHLADALDHLRMLRGHRERADLRDATVADAVLMRLVAARRTVPPPSRGNGPPEADGTAGWARGVHEARIRARQRVAPRCIAP